MSQTLALLTDPREMEPMFPEEGNRRIEDLVFELSARASSLAGQIHPIVTETIGNLVRSINCHYSNLIEGHDTHPLDIERALRHDFSSQPQRRALQHEAVAHIEVQKAIDEGRDDPSDALTAKYAQWLHREFCRQLPTEMLWVQDPQSGRQVRVTPGEFRDDEVVVGRHLPPAAKALQRFVTRFDDAYDCGKLSRMRQLAALAAAHHRFLWIHPFFDANGRVVRLMSHASLKRMGIGSSLWSVARGLARNVDRYKELLAAADEPRHSDSDGPGPLSLSALTEFCEFFLETCLDQVQFMSSILNPTELLRRMEIYVEEEIRAERLPKGTFPLLREGLLAGEFERGSAPSITGYGERSARNVVSRLIEEHLLVSDTPKGRLRLGFPIPVVDRWFPSLYPSAPV